MGNISFETFQKAVNPSIGSKTSFGGAKSSFVSSPQRKTSPSFRTVSFETFQKAIENDVANKKWKYQQESAGYLSEIKKTNIWTSAEDMDGYIQLTKDRAAKDTANKSVYDEILKDLESRKKVYSEFESADEYNTALQDSKWREKYKGYSYDQIQQLLAERGRRGTGDDAETAWLKNYGMAVGYGDEESYDKHLAKLDRKIEENNSSIQNIQFGTQVGGYSEEADQVRTLEEENQKIEVEKATLARAKSVLVAQKKLDAYKEQLEGAADFADKSQYDFKEIDPIYRAVNGNNLSATIPSDDQTLATGMEPQEAKIYNYLFKTQGKKAATAYFDDLRPILNERANTEQATAVKEFADKNWFTATVANIGTLGSQLIDGTVGSVKKLGGSLTGDYEKNWSQYDKLTTFTNTVRTDTAQDLIQKTGWDGAGFIYNTLMSIADMGVALGVGGIVGKVAGGASAAVNSSKVAKGVTQFIMSSEAASHTMTDARARGLSGFQIAALGVVSAGIEAATEKLPLDNLFGEGAKGLKFIAKQIVTEGAEEAISSVLNTFADEVIAGNESAIKQQIGELMASGTSYQDAAQKVLVEKAKEVGLDALGGALSGGIMGGGAAAISRLANVYYSVPKKYTGTMEQTHEWTSNAFSKLQNGTRIKALDTVTENHNGVKVREEAVVSLDAEAMSKAIGQTKNADQAVAFAAINDIMKKGKVTKSELGTEAKVHTAAMLNGNAHPVEVFLQKQTDTDWSVARLVVDDEVVYDASQYVNENVGDVESAAKLVAPSNKVAFDYEALSNISQESGGIIDNEATIVEDIDYDALERYDQRTYTNHGWVAVNRVLTGREQTKLYAQWADAVENRFKYPQTPKGDTIITVGDGYDDASTTVFISGTNQNPIISEVVKIVSTDSSDVSSIREQLIEGEEQGDVYCRTIIESAFGQGVLVSKQSGDFASYRQLRDADQERRSGNISNGNRTLGNSGRGSDPSNFARDNQTVKNSIYDSSLPSVVDGTGSIAVDQNSSPDVQESRSYDYTESAENWTAEHLNEGSDGKVLAVSDIVAYIEKIFDVPINKGNIRQKNAAGIFKAKVNAIRTQLGNALPTICHELGHLLDKNHCLTALASIDEAVEVMQKRNPQFAALYGENQQKGEAVAEFVREYLRDRKAAREQYPQFFDAFVRSLGSDLGKINALSDKVNAYMHSSVAEQVAANTTTRAEARRKKESNRRFSAALEKVRDWFADDVGAVKQVSEAAYKGIYSARKAPVVAEFVLREGMVDIDGNAVAGYENIGLADVLAPVIESKGGKLKKVGEKLSGQHDNDYDAFGTYLILKRGLDLLDNDIPMFKNGDVNLTDKAKVQQEIDRMEAEYPAFKETANQLYAWQRQFYQTWYVDTGLMTQADYDAMWKKHPHYVPFNRNVRQEIERRSKGGVANQGTGIKKIRGSSEELFDPIENIVMRAALTVEAGKRNRIMQILALEVENGGIDSTVMEKISATRAGAINEALDEEKVLSDTEKIKKRETKIYEFDRSAETITANIHSVAEMQSVYDVPSSALTDSGKSIVNIYQEFFDKWGGELHSDELGTIDVKTSSIRSERRHGSTAEKIAAIEAIPSVVKNGKVVFVGDKSEGRVQRIVLSAPIKIGGKPYLLGAMVQRDNQYQRLYLHDVIIEEEASASSSDDLNTTGSNEESENLFITTILQRVLKVKRGKKSGNKFLKRSADTDEKSELGDPLENIDIVEWSGQKNSENVVWAMINGERVLYEVHDEQLLNSLLSSTPKQGDLLVSFLKMTGGAFKSLTTGSNLIWSICSNSFRDFKTGYLFGSEGNIFKYTRDYAKAFKDIVTNSERYQEARSAGLGYNSRISQPKTLARVMQQLGQSSQGRRALRNAFSSIIEGIQSISEVVEATPRMAEYNRAIKQGKTKTDAVYAASEVTLNFDRNGTISKKIDLLYPFFNVQMQGLYKQATMLSDPKTRTSFIRRNVTSAVISALFVISANAVLGGKDEYEKLSDYVKNNYYCIYIGNGKFIRIPKARELDMLESALERLGEVILYGNEGGDAFNDFAEYVFQAYAPLGFPDITALFEETGKDKLVGFIKPTVTDLLFLGSVGEVFLNENYAGSPIVPTQYEDLVAELQYDNKTSAVSKWLGKLTGMSPMKLDHLITSNTGFVGKMIKAYTATDVDWSGGYGNQFTTDLAYSNEATGEFYDKLDEAEMFANSYPDNAQYQATYRQYQSVSSVLSYFYRKAREEPAFEREYRMAALAYAEEFLGDGGAQNERLNEIFANTNDKAIYPYIQFKDTYTKTEKDKDGNSHKVEVVMTSEEFMEYVGTYNATVDGLYGEILEGISDTTLASKALVKAKEEANEYARSGEMSDVMIAKEAGISAAQYYTIYYTASTDGNNSIKKEEAIKVLDASVLTRKQKEVVFELLGNWKQNPYKKRYY